MRLRRSLLLLSLALVPTISTAEPIAPAPAFDTARMDRAFDALESHQRIQGSVAIRRDGRLIYSRALGRRDGRTENDTATRFRVGSITKVFTATLVYQLIDEHRLTLATPLSAFFPQIANAREITIAHLLAHASGLPNFPEPGDAADPAADPNAWVHQPQTKARMLQRFAAMKAVTPPGERVAYSNVNYVLLGYIVEAVTHSTYAHELRKRIVRPAGLRRTRFGGQVRVADNEAHSYGFDDGKWVEQPEEDLSVSAGAGAVVSTPEDLTRFASALFAGRLLRPESVREMLAPFSPQLDGAERKGVVVSTLHRGLEKTIYSHLGGIDGFSSNLVYFPRDLVAIAIVFNGQNFPMGRLFWLLADGAFGLEGPALSFDGLERPAESLDSYAGTYRLAAIGMDIVVRRDGGQFLAQATGQDAFAIEPIAAPTQRFDALFWDRSGIVLEFRRADDRSISALVLFQGRSEMRFERLPP